MNFYNLFKYFNHLSDLQTLVKIQYNQYNCLDFKKDLSKTVIHYNIRNPFLNEFLKTIVNVY